MKKNYLFCFAVVGMLSFFSCSSDQDVMKESLEARNLSDSTNINIQDEIENFEKSYFQNVKTRSNNQVKMFGYKTMKLEEGKDKEVVKWVSKNYQKEIAEMKGLFIASDFSFYRVYFPMHTAIVDFMGEEYKADEQGVIDLAGSS